MIEVLSTISIVLGIILKIAAFIALFVMMGMVIYFINKAIPDSKCHGNCNQGRNCNCKES